MRRKARFVAFALSSASLGVLCQESVEGVRLAERVELPRFRRLHSGPRNGRLRGSGGRVDIAKLAKGADKDRSTVLPKDLK